MAAEPASARRDRDRKRRRSDAGEGSEKKPNFDRIWAEEDEIKLLQALIDCRKEHGDDPASSVDLVRDHLNLPFSRNQVYDKIRRLKHRFEFASAKLKNTRRGPIKPHDKAAFELSQQIWKADDLPVKSGRNHLGRVVELLTEERPDLMPREVILKGFKRIPSSRALELDRRWRAHCLQGMKYSLQESAIKSEILRACLASLDGVGL
ncbi:putative transcription factor At1g61730 [Wolffia australiana]